MLTFLILKLFSKSCTQKSQWKIGIDDQNSKQSQLMIGMFSRLLTRVETKMFIFVFLQKNIFLLFAKKLTKSCENFCQNFRKNFCSRESFRKSFRFHKTFFVFESVFAKIFLSECRSGSRIFRENFRKN
jgi:hypothetical protein